MKRIWPFAFYLLYFGANACYLPYLVLYYQSLDFTGAQIGLLVAISPLVTLIGAPLWTGIADVSRQYKLVMSLTLLRTSWKIQQLSPCLGMISTCTAV